MTTAILILARTLHIGCAMLLFTLPYFARVILRPMADGEGAESREAFCRRLVKWLWVAWVVEGVSGLAWVWFVTAQMSDESPWGMLDRDDLSAVLWQTQFGGLWMWRAGLGIALGAALIFLSRGKGLRAPGRSWLSQAVMAMSGMLLVTLAWAGHGASGVRFHDLHLGADVLHLATGAIWPMGLIPMAGFLWQLQRSGRELPRAGEIEALERFSRISLGAVVVIVLTGVINGWLMVGSWEALVTTTYGWLLVGKLALVGMMIGFGALNRLYLLPRIESETILFRMLQKTVLAESGLAAIVLLIVGMMGMTAPPS